MERAGLENNQAQRFRTPAATRQHHCGTEQSNRATKHAIHSKQPSQFVGQIYLIKLADI
jgi:hypothetical protein